MEGERKVLENFQKTKLQFQSHLENLLFSSGHGNARALEPYRKQYSLDGARRKIPLVSDEREGTSAVGTDLWSSLECTGGNV